MTNRKMFLGLGLGLGLGSPFGSWRSKNHAGVNIGVNFEQRLEPNEICIYTRARGLMLLVHSPFRHQREGLGNGQTTYPMDASSRCLSLLLPKQHPILPHFPPLHVYPLIPA